MLSRSSPLRSVLFITALAACSPPPQESSQGDSSAPATAPVYAAPKNYDAISRTAEAITGRLEIADSERGGEYAPPRVKITLGLGHVYEGDWVGTSKASSNIGGEAWTALLPVPETADVSVYAVSSESVNAKAPNGGLCSPDKTGFVAITEYKNAMGGDELQMAAFKDAQWPPQDKSGLCGTFTYIAAAE